MERGLGLGAILSLVLAYAVLAQGGGWNQNSHYALIKALDDGTAVIDQTRNQTGQWYVTGDIAVYRGHTYSQKAPGLAFVTLAPYVVMKAVGKAHAVADQTGQLWFLGLFGVVLPALLLLLLVRRIADALEPGLGTIAALILGLATLVLPFADQFFSHLLSAFLVFGAFAALWYERRGPPSLAWVAAAGLLAGYSVTTEFPNAMVVAILGLFALARSGWPRRALAYGAGALVGVAPLLGYNQWAFGSPFHVSYENTVGFGATHTLFFTAPSFRRLVEVLFAPTGILRTTPVLGLAVVGLVILYRRGRHFEVLAVTAITIAFLGLEACYTFAFGGAVPGPRYVIPMLPFLALPLAVACKRMPLTTIVLAGASAVEMIAATITHPIWYSQTSANWFHRLGLHDFTATVLAFLGPSHSYFDEVELPSTRSWYPLLLFFVPVVVALALAAAERPPLPRSARDAFRAAAFLGGWLVLQYEGPRLLGDNAPVGHEWAPLLVLLLAGVLIALASAFPSLVRPSRR